MGRGRRWLNFPPTSHLLLLLQLLLHVPLQQSVAAEEDGGRPVLVKSGEPGGNPLQEKAMKEEKTIAPNSTQVIQEPHPDSRRSNSTSTTSSVASAGCASTSETSLRGASKKSSNQLFLEWESWSSFFKEKLSNFLCNEAITEDLLQRSIDMFHMRGQDIFVFDMPLNVLKEHPLFTQNPDTVECKFNHYVSICHASNKAPYIYMFVHDCLLSVERGFKTIAFYSLIYADESNMILCSNDTRVLFRDRPGWVTDVLVLEQRINDSQEDNLITPFRYLGLRYLSTVTFRFRHKIFNNQTNFGYPAYVNVTNINRQSMKDPRSFFNRSSHDLQAIITHLAEHFGVDSRTLLTEPRFKQSVGSLLQVAVNAIARRKFRCVRNMTEGLTTVYEDGGTVFVENAIVSGKLNPCVWVSLRGTYEFEMSERGEHISFNIFWPGCRTMNMMIMGRKPLQSEWFYLSNGCRIIQIICFLITALITIVTIGGNMLVLTIIHNYDMFLISRKGPVFYILRSLAVADLLTGLFPGALAVWDQLALMTGHLTLFQLNKEEFSFKINEIQLTESLQDHRIERNGYPMFCGLVLSVTSVVSLFMLLLLSFERYAGVTSKFFPCRYAVGSVWVAWILACILGVLLFSRVDGFYPAGYFDPISKLTVSTARSSRSVSILVFYLEVLFVAATGLTTVGLTLYTLVTFRGYRRRREALGVQHADPQYLDEEDKKFFNLSWCLTLLYLISCLPLAVTVFFGISRDIPIIQFISWWLFMAGSSWNWFVYAYSRKSLKGNAKLWMRNVKTVVANLVPANVPEKLKAAPTKAEEHINIYVLSWKKLEDSVQNSFIGK